MGVSEIEQGLYISDVHHVMENDVEEMYDIVITVCRNDPSMDEDCPAVHQQFGLWDDDTDQYETFDKAVQATVKALTVHRGDTLVHCIAGKSRSPAVVATAIAYRDDIHFDEARAYVEHSRPHISIEPSLRDMGLEFLGQTGPGNDPRVP